MSDKTFYLTTPIYYVNARPHIGHAYSTIVADVLARRHRLLGEETYFLTGTDEHGQKIERSAAAAGIEPQQFADQVSATFRALWERMGITNDQFIRTTSEQHKAGVQKLFRTLYDNGFIYLDSYTGSYCVSDEAFMDQPVGTPCPDCGRPLEEVTEENFFFKLSAFQQPLIELIESDTLKITPDSAKNEVLSFVRGGLKDLSISRSSFRWGIDVPEDIQQAAGAKQKHVVYVWLDALANYITALGYGSADETLLERFWPANVHLVGKEITRFHCVYWPAFLLAAKLPTPRQVTANGWLLFDNAKMSKSKGNIVRTETILAAFGDEVYGRQFPESTRTERDLFASDVLRYFLLREIPFGQDGSFSFDAMITRYNADLANGYGNLVSRTLSLINKRGGKIADDQIAALDPNFHANDVLSYSKIKELQGKVADDIADCMFASALSQIMSLISMADGYVSQYSPWKLVSSTDPLDHYKADFILGSAARLIRIITALLYPVLPYTTAKVWAQLGLGDIEDAARSGQLNNLTWGGLEPGTKLGALAPLFPRAPKELAEIMSTIEEQNAAAPNSQLTTDQTTEQSTAQAATTPAAAPATDAVATAEPTSQQRPDASPEVTIDDFVKVELRVAEVVVCDRVPKADKLLRLEVSLGQLPDGSTEQRQILSGIAEWYTPEEMVGKRIIVITNLAPRKMRGLESHGMLLAASEPGGKPMLATVPEGVPVGTRLK
jgi:methionyl-tRNA synthetase